MYGNSPNVLNLIVAKFAFPNILRVDPLVMTVAMIYCKSAPRSNQY